MSRKLIAVLLAIFSANLAQATPPAQGARAEDRLNQQVDRPPTLAGNYAASVTAQNATGTGAPKVVNFAIAVGAPAITSAASANGAVGVAYPGYTITATNGPPFVAFGARNLPPGLTVNAATGAISGTPTLAGNYAATADYFLVYPEDIKLIGASFNTQLGKTGIALQGEVSHRLDVPLQVDDVELLYAALSPLRLLPPIPQLAPLIGLGTLLANNNQVGAYGFSQEITGYRRFDTTQVQMTFTKAFS